MRATEHAPRDPIHVLERRHGLAEVVERGLVVPVKRLRVNRPHPEATSRRAALCRGLAATIDGDLAAAHHDADLPSVVEELPFDRQEALAWRAEIKEQQKENLREIQRMCGMDRPPRAAETWMLLSTALRKEPPAKPPRPWGGFKNDDDDDDAESQTSTLPEQPTAALASDVAKLARERALRNPGLFSADGLFAPDRRARLRVRRRWRTGRAHLGRLRRGPLFARRYLKTTSTQKL